MSACRVLCSDGQLSARVDVVFAVPVSGASPCIEAERVVLTDPSRLPRPVELAPSSSGPRRADELRKVRKVPGLDFPDGLSAMQVQRVMIDPEVWLASEPSVERK